MRTYAVSAIHVGDTKGPLTSQMAQIPWNSRSRGTAALGRLLKTT